MLRLRSSGSKGGAASPIDWMHFKTKILHENAFFLIKTCSNFFGEWAQPPPQALPYPLLFPFIPYFWVRHCACVLRCTVARYRWTRKPSVLHCQTCVSQNKSFSKVNFKSFSASERLRPPDPPTGALPLDPPGRLCPPDGDAEIARPDIARLDNVRPCSKSGHRETWHCETM